MKGDFFYSGSRAHLWKRRMTLTLCFRINVRHFKICSLSYIEEKLHITWGNKTILWTKEWDFETSSVLKNLEGTWILHWQGRSCQVKKLPLLFYYLNFSFSFMKDAAPFWLVLFSLHSNNSWWIAIVRAYTLSCLMCPEPIIHLFLCLKCLSLYSCCIKIIFSLILSVRNYKNI